MFPGRQKRAFVFLHYSRAQVIVDARHQARLVKCGSD